MDKLLVGGFHPGQFLFIKRYIFLVTNSFITSDQFIINLEIIRFELETFKKVPDTFFRLFHYQICYSKVMIGFQIQWVNLDYPVENFH